jgi:hypothetical protein
MPLASSTERGDLPSQALWVIPRPESVGMAPKQAFWNLEPGEPRGVRQMRTCRQKPAKQLPQELKHHFAG